MAIHDNELAARSQGIAVGRMKLAVYAAAAFGAGWAGALYFVGNLRISPDAAACAPRGWRSGWRSPDGSRPLRLDLVLNPSANQAPPV
ncbi:ABC transporter permease subunit [Verminephrobacter eiseniae]|uniref:ABC transporter permease subunit n=1 Tax=Verminephrobacter eiseniae TaxID=364317 RepID=UPI002ADD866B|nr:hypothetical protein [Verminephrobacter eiseniae]